jgi:serine/threonine protein kinase
VRGRRTEGNPVGVPRGTEEAQRSTKKKKKENMLYQMMLKTGERFSPKHLTNSERAADYFGSDFEQKIRPYVVQMVCRRPPKGILQIRDPTDVPIIVKFIRRCLRLAPSHQATAEETLRDPWLQGVDDEDGL